MLYHAFGREGAETIMLLHGGGLSWWNYRDEARLLADEYRVILPYCRRHYHLEPDILIAGLQILYEKNRTK